MVWRKDPNESSDGKIRLGSLIWVNQRRRHKNNENRIDEQTETEKVEKVGVVRSNFGVGSAPKR